MSKHSCAEQCVEMMNDTCDQVSNCGRFRVLME